MNKISWIGINAKLFLYGALSVIGLALSAANGAVLAHNILFTHRLLSLFGVALFAVAITTFLHVLTDGIRKTIIYHRLGVGRAAALQFILRVFGYLAIFFTVLDRIGIPIGHLLVGGAVLGIILGVAAQQALGNFFASIVLIVAHPFAVGDTVTLVSGALGGRYDGKVDDIGLTHTRLQQEDGTTVEMPNSTLLVGAAITVHPRSKAREAAEALAKQ